jgi:hypothetical protein
MRYNDKEDVREGALAERDLGATANAMAASAKNVVGDDTVHFNRMFITSVVARTATTPAPFVEIDQPVIPTLEQYRTAPKIVKARQQHKRVARVRTPWHKLLYGWVALPLRLVKKK